MTPQATEIRRLHRIVRENNQSHEEEVLDLLDLARNVAGIDEGFLVSAGLDTLRATLRELRDEARLAIEGR